MSPTSSWRRLIGTGGALLVVLLACPPHLRSAPAPAAPSVAEDKIVPLTEVRQIRQLPLHPFSKPQEVRLVGVITYHDPSQNLTFLQDATGGIQLYPSPRDPQIQPGGKLQIEGQLITSGIRRVVSTRRVSVLGTDMLPRSASTPHYRVISGTMDSQWTETIGVVRQVNVTTNQLKLRVAIRGGELLAIVDRPAAWQREINVDIKLSLTGVAQVYSEAPRTPDRLRLLIADGNQITLVAPPGDAPFNLPIRAITNLLVSADTTMEPFNRQHFLGTVTAIFPGKAVYLHDKPGSIRIAHAGETPFAVGDVVHVVAYPQFTDQTLELADALFQKTGEHQPIVPSRINDGQTARRTRNGELVQANGRIVGWTYKDNEAIVWLQSKQFVFGGIIPNPGRPESLPFKKQNMLELVGICSSLTPESSQGQSFQILLRGPEDFQVLEVAPWWTHWNTAGVLGFMGLVTIMTATWVVTLRRQLGRQTERIRQSEEHLRFAIEAADMGTWEYLPQKREFYWRDAQPAKRFPRAKGSGTLETLFAQIHPLDRELVEKTIEQVGLIGRTFQLEYRVGAADGTQGWRFMQGHGFRDAYGRVTRVIGVIQDVTHRKEAEQALREREEIYRAMFEKNRAVKLLIEPESGQIVDANPAAADFYGYSLEELKSKRIQDLTPLAESRMLDLLRQAQNGDNDLFHLSQCLFNGSRREVEIYAGSLNVGGRSLLFCIVLDVSEQVRATEAMRRLNEALESRVQDRTEELQQRVAEVEDLNANMIVLLEDLKSAHLEAANAARQTEAANRQLQTTNQELEAFSYSVSHDLRAPLRHIAGYVSILMEGHSQQLDNEGRRYLQTIEKAAKRMGQLIDDLLAFSRIGRAQLSVRRFALNEVVQEVIRELTPELTERSVEWRIQTLPVVHGDPSLIRQVLYNLIDNALKYSRPRKTAVIEIGLLSNSETAADHTLFVRDNGVGFDMNYSGKLFGVFQRLHTTSQFEGTGIGLANVRRIILRHGGRTWAEAQPEAGACFFFTLPKVARPESTEADHEVQTLEE
jgi:PAS domain S-box-containing protein